MWATSFTSLPLRPYVLYIDWLRNGQKRCRLLQLVTIWSSTARPKKGTIQSAHSIGDLEEEEEGLKQPLKRDPEGERYLCTREEAQTRLSLAFRNRYIPFSPPDYCIYFRDLRRFALPCPALTQLSPTTSTFSSSLIVVTLGHYFIH